MRIGFFTDFYLPVHNGVTYSVERFRKQLEALGHEVYVFAPSPSLRVQEDDDHIIRFPAIKGLFVENYLTSVFFPPQQVRKIEQMNLDLIHFHTPSQIGLLGAHVAIKNNIPLVTTYHTDLREYIKQYPWIFPALIALSFVAPLITGGGIKDAQEAMQNIKPKKKLDEWKEHAIMRMMTQLHNYCDYVIAPSKKIEHELTRWHTTAPIAVLPTGVDKITANAAQTTAYREQFGLEETDQVVMFAGRLAPEKNLDLLVKAFAKVYQQNPRAKLLLVGDYTYTEELTKLATEHSIEHRLIITGYIENAKLGSLYACATVFVLPSLTDTQCLVLNEAAHAGLPLIAVDRDINEVLQDGVNGTLAKPTIRGLAAAIEDILRHPAKAKTMGASSQRLAKRFSEEKQGQKLAELYAKIIAGRQA